tara:strand:+ start:301 stop:753 length:453 start_codon:yes stop_codon:yes gene_type:complete
MKSSFTERDKNFLKTNLFPILSNPKIIAEIGNYTGTSTKFFSEELPDVKLYSVDIKKQKLGNLNKNVEVVIKNSLDWIPPERLDFIYLDGDHSIDHVIKEINHFCNYTNIIAGHDAMIVKEALMHFLIQQEIKLNLLITNTCSSWIATFD